MKCLNIDLGERSYDVLVGQGALSELGSRVKTRLGQSCTSIALVCDARVWPLHGERVERALAETGWRLSVHRMPEGEKAKDLGPFGRLHEELVAAGHDRRSLLVALGGGAVGDAAGFAAATFMRGIRFLQVPTTLLAMVDASVGGKTAINLEAGKNLVGAFHQPVLVVADLECLSTLPAREVRTGLGEVLKYGLMAQPQILDLLEAHLAGHDGLPPTATLEEIVARSVAIKASYVTRDEREAGLREHLNLGHTFAHGLEAATHYERYRHGEAVALGLIAACRLGELTRRLDPSLTQRMKTLIEALSLPAKTDLEPSVVRAHMGTDKKRAGGRLRFVVPTAAGHLDTLEDATEETILESLGAIT